jgi:hypothetical protein
VRSALLLDDVEGATGGIAEAPGERIEHERAARGGRHRGDATSVRTERECGHHARRPRRRSSVERHLHRVADADRLSAQAVRAPERTLIDDDELEDRSRRHAFQ